MSNPYLRGGKANCFYEPYLRLCEIIMESHSVIESFTIDFRAEKYLGLSVNACFFVLCLTRSSN